MDGQLSGAAFPYLAIYTGGFVPAAWRWAVSYPLGPFSANLLGRRPIPSYRARLVLVVLSTKILTPFLGT